jgi:aryl-alcohol dehydrogenase-like predicted oxidoreductase
MELRTLGSTGLVVSPIGLGMAALGRPGYINLEHAKDLAGKYDQAVMEHRAHTVLDTAWNAGIRYFDAARSYGLGDRFLGSWLSSRAISAEMIAVGSKWGYTYTADWKVQAESHEIKEHSLATLQRQWRESVALLNGYLQLYQIHSATVESGVLDKIDVLKQLAYLRSQGVHIGVSVSGPGQAETVRKAMEIDLDGMRLFETVQATWNLLEPSVGPALSEARAAGIGVIIKEALANGRLTDRNKESGFGAKLGLLQREAIRCDSSIDALVLASCLAQPFADVVLSGATTVAQTLSNVASCRIKLDEEAMMTLATFAEPSQRYWATRKELPWN